MADDRCIWSDLPPAMCSHCNPYRTSATLRLVRHNLAIAAENILDTIASRPALTHPTGRTLPQDLKDWRLSDYVAALCDHTRNAEPREIIQHHTNGSITTYVQRHITVSPPLLIQLQEAAASSRGMDGGNRIFGSSPSAALEALDLGRHARQSRQGQRGPWPS